MTEKLLQFIWKHRYFNQQELTLLSGEALSVEYPGEQNRHQGPDFIHARIKINGISWAGSVELHLFSSGWDKHGHEQDESYRNVILHVVWMRDPVQMKRNIPQLELHHRVSQIMLETYADWLNRHGFVPCERSLPLPQTQTWNNWKQALLLHRLERRMISILHSLRMNHYHWEEQLWWMLAGNFGMKVNAAAFEAVARSLPFSLLAKHRQQRLRLEALLLGQANLLEEDFTETYPALLKREFDFLKKKYRLKKVYEQVLFLRMRPDNFPTIRLSQLAALCGESGHLFAWILHCHSLAALRKKLSVSAHDYWNRHYVFGRESPLKEKMLGLRTGESIIINTVVPLLYSYGSIYPDGSIRQKAISWMQEIRAEENEIISKWKRLGIRIKTAAESQALLELKNEFCQQKRCLECEVGKKLLSSGSGNNAAGERATPQ